MIHDIDTTYNKEKILQFLIENKNHAFTSLEIAEKFDEIGIASTKTYISRLVKKDQVKKVGKTGKSVLYQFNNGVESTGNNELFLDAMKTFLTIFQENKSGISLKPDQKQKIGELVQKFKEVSQ